MRNSSVPPQKNNTELSWKVGISVVQNLLKDELARTCAHKQIFRLCFDVNQPRADLFCVDQSENGRSGFAPIKSVPASQALSKQDCETSSYLVRCFVELLPNKQ